MRVATAPECSPAWPLLSGPCRPEFQPCGAGVQGYFQEIGRGGRDGKPAECTLFYSSADIASVRFVVSKGKKGDRGKEARLQQLNEVPSALRLRRQGAPTHACMHLDLYWPERLRPRHPLGIR